MTSAFAFVFPGQGSQAVGMGRALADAFPSARAVFDEVDAALGDHLSRIMWDGPAETLTLTANAQPALMAVSLAVVRVLEAEHGLTVAANARLVAGHSLGEYSALAASGAISIGDTARLLRLRGNAMQAAVPVGQGAMAALIGADIGQAETIAALAAEGDVCAVANDNAPGQVVISGHKTAIDRAVAIGPQHGARRVMLLPVSAPFHCPLMAPAAEAMAAALAETAIAKPVVPVMANVVAGLIEDPEEIRQRLVEQVTGRVRWRESVAAMADLGVTTLCELGAGRVLTGMARRIDERLEGVAACTPEEVATLAAKLRSNT